MRYTLDMKGEVEGLGYVKEVEGTERCGSPIKLRGEPVVGGRLGVH